MHSKTVPAPGPFDESYGSVPLVYVAGPYRAKSVAAIDTNIFLARELGKLVASHGAYPIIPHSNTGHFEGCAPDSFWLPGTLRACSVCDGIILRWGWEDSEGSRGEYNLMTHLGKKIFFETDPTWQASMSSWVRGPMSSWTMRRV